MQPGNDNTTAVTMRRNARLGFPESEYRRRYDLVMTRMREAKLDAMLVKKNRKTGEIEKMSLARWQAVIDVNLTANWRLIRSFDPLLRLSDAGRAIFVTSSIARAPKAYWGAYAVRKAALEMLVRTYAAEIVKTNVRANLLDPGAVATRMRTHAFPGENPETLPTPMAITDRFVELASPTCELNGEVVGVS